METVKTWLSLMLLGIVKSSCIPDGFKPMTAVLFILHRYSPGDSDQQIHSLTTRWSTFCLICDSAHVGSSEWDVRQWSSKSERLSQKWLGYHANCSQSIVEQDCLCWLSWLFRLGEFFGSQSMLHISKHIAIDHSNDFRVDFGLFALSFRIQ